MSSSQINRGGSAPVLQSAPSVDVRAPSCTVSIRDIFKKIFGFGQTRAIPPVATTLAVAPPSAAQSGRDSGDAGGADLLRTAESTVPSGAAQPQVGSAAAPGKADPELSDLLSRFESPKRRDSNDSFHSAEGEDSEDMQHAADHYRLGRAHRGGEMRQELGRAVDALDDKITIKDEVEPVAPRVIQGADLSPEGRELGAYLGAMAATILAIPVPVEAADSSSTAAEPQVGSADEAGPSSAPAKTLDAETIIGIFAQAINLGKVATFESGRVVNVNGHNWTVRINRNDKGDIPEDVTVVAKKVRWFNNSSFFDISKGNASETFYVKVSKGYYTITIQ